MSRRKSKVEKETRRIMEAITDAVKKKNGRYRIKSKNKKVVKQLKRTCVHWILKRSKGETPMVLRDPNQQDYWICQICGAKFPIKPLEITKDNNGYKINPYDDTANKMLELVNQLLFYSIKLGGSAEDTRLFLRLKTDLPRIRRVSNEICKALSAREAFVRNRKNRDIFTQFDAYNSGINYR